MLVKAAEITLNTLDEHQVRPADLHRALTSAAGPGKYSFNEALSDYGKQKAVRILIDDQARIWRDHTGDIVVIDVRTDGPRGHLRVPLSRPFDFSSLAVPEYQAPPPKQTPPQRKLLLL